MRNPYPVTMLIYVFVAALMAFDAAMISIDGLPFFNGVIWLRVHLITLGVATQALFGGLPGLVASRAGRAAPAPRWDIWLVLNAGLIVLLTGVPGINQPLVFAGGMLVFVAALLLVVQIADLRTASGHASHEAGPSARFHIAGLLYLLLGITVGTGLWLGWSQPLRIQVPREVHVHANSWGFLSLVFAGLLIDIVPAVSGRPLASKRALELVFWAMTTGALGLVAGPWLGDAIWATLPGLLLHTSATLSLLVLVARRLFAAGLSHAPGLWQLLSAYAWILLPILVAPMVLLKVPGFVSGDIEATAPQALVYGWILQVAIVVTPFLVARHLLSDSRAGLGGSWFGFACANTGSALVWASIFAAPLRNGLHAAGYLLYLAALMPFGVQLVRQLIAAGRATAHPAPHGAGQ